MIEILSSIISYLIKCFPSLTIIMTISLIIIIPIILLSVIIKSITKQDTQIDKIKYH